MCYQYPFAVLPVVVPAPESHRSVSIPLGMLVSLSESHGILRRGIISPPDGYSIVKVQVPSLVWAGEGALGRCFGNLFYFSLYEFPLGRALLGGIFQKMFLSHHLFPLRTRFGQVVLKEIFHPSTCSDWEGRFFRVFYKKLLRENEKSHAPVRYVARTAGSTKV